MFSSLSAAAQPSDDNAVKDVNLSSFVKDVLEASKTALVLVEFGATWCGPCKQLTPVLEKIARESNGAVKLAKIDIDRNQQIAQQMGVQSVPSVFAFIGGRPVDGFAGALPESDIKKWLAPLQKAAGGGSDEKAKAEAIAAAMKQAAEMMAAKDYATARAVYADILDMEAENAAAFAGLVKCAVEEGDLATAREMLDAADPAIAKDKAMDSVRTALELAEQAATAGDGATAEWEAKLAADANDHQARFDLAVALYGQGKREEAVDHLLEIVKRARNWNEDGARKQLVKFFEAMGPMDPLTVSARRRLSSLLFS